MRPFITGGVLVCLATTSHADSGALNKLGQMTQARRETDQQAAASRESRNKGARDLLKQFGGKSIFRDPHAAALRDLLTAQGASSKEGVLIAKARYDKLSLRDWLKVFYLDVQPTGRNHDLWGEIALVLTPRGPMVQSWIRRDVAN